MPDGPQERFYVKDRALDSWELLADHYVATTGAEGVLARALVTLVDAYRHAKGEIEVRPAVSDDEIRLAKEHGPCTCHPGSRCKVHWAGGCSYCFHAWPAWPCPAEVAYSGSPVPVSS